MGHLVQMAGLAVQNFVSAAVGHRRRRRADPRLLRGRTDRIGNFWVDLVRVTFRVLLPIAFVAAVALVAMGAIQNFSSGTDVSTLAGHHQTLTGGPVASQEAIKELGTNGGGFYNANSSHPFENPNPLSNLFEIFLLLLIPVALTRTFGTMVGDRRQGYAILAVMARALARCAGRGHDPGDAPPRRRCPGGGSLDGGQGDAVRRTGVLAVRRVHHRHVDRRRGLLPLLLRRGRRWCAAPQHGARRGRARRRRLGPLRHPRAGHPHRVRRGTDGRPDAGVPAQEDHRSRDQAGRAEHPHHADGRADRHRRRDVAARPGSPRCSTEVHTGSPRCSTPSCRPATTTARPSRA